MAGINEKINTMLFPMGFERQFAGPLDAKEVWYDLEALKAYAKSTTSGSYTGQTVKFVDKTQENKITIYTIKADGTLVAGVWDDTYTKTETDTKVSNLRKEITDKIDNLENGRVWKPSVDTFNDISKKYPTPQDTWCVITKDTNIIWMYEEKNRKWIDLGHSVIHNNATQSKDGLMSKEDKTKIDNLETTINEKVKPVSDKLNTVESNYKAEDVKINARIDEIISKTTTATDMEIEELLTPQMIKEILEMATEQDIRLLFDGTSLSGGETYNLSGLTEDETKVVNMKLLSLFNDLLSRKITDTNGTLKNQLEAIINEKANKTDLDKSVENLNSKIATKFDKNTKLELGSCLSGSTDFTGNVSISLNVATDAEIEKLFEGGLV